jgi:ornithine cyclodeaminase
VSIGSFAADRCEVGRDVVGGADVVVDHLPTALVHAGPVVDGVREGLLAIDDIGEIGQVLLGARALDRDPDRVTYYNSVGVGVQDAAAVTLLLEAAARSGRGKRVDW